MPSSDLSFRPLAGARPSEARSQRASTRLEVSYDSGGVVAVDKPAGLPSTGRTLDDPDCVQHLLAERLGRPVWAVHQLDADTSGVLVFVTRKSLVGRWAERLRPARADKRYLAFCHGRPDFARREVDVPLVSTGRRTPPFWRVAARDERGARAARSVVRVLARGTGHALVEVVLKSGRSHQVRLHLAHLGHPLVGEKVYRDPPCEALARHALHASSIRFRDGDEPAAFAAPLPRDLVDLARRLAIELPAGVAVAAAPGESGAND